MTKDDAKPNLQWHPAFVQAMQAELFDYRDVLEFRQEYLLNASPLQIDLLIIKKKRDVVIDKNIARIFRTDNVVEYKGPEDYLSVKDFWQVCAYANLYAAITPGVDLADVTLTFVERRRPEKLLEYLAKIRGYMVEEPSPGIYLVKGDYIPIQIIESQKLNEDENLWLESLRGDLKKSRLNAILRQAEKQGRQPPLDAYIDIILRANQKNYKEVNKMGWQDTLCEIFEEDIPEKVESYRAQGREEAARNALAEGATLEFVQKITGLDIDRVRELSSAIQA